MLDGDFVQLDARYNFVKRRLSGDLPVPDSTAILHFTGRHKPWQGGEAGYREAEDRWHEFELSDAEFHAAYLALPGAKHHDLLVHYGTPHVRRTGSPEDARKVAASHIAAGEYQEAADLLGRVRIPVDESWPHEVLGHALMSVSRYEEARARLLLATASPNRAPTAFARLAQIAWIHGDDDAAAEYALKGLAVDPTHRANRLMHKRTTHLPPPAEGPAASTSSPMSPSTWSARATPGTSCCRRAYGWPSAGTPARGGGTPSTPTGSSTRPRWNGSTNAGAWSSAAAASSSRTPRPTATAAGSGTSRTNCSTGSTYPSWSTRSASTPSTARRTGTGGSGSSPACSRLVERASFFGLRNHGSIEKVRELLPASLHDKVRFQPCPTTVTRQLVDGWADPVRREDTVLINAAYDRSGLRFGHDYGHFLAEMATAVRELGTRAEVQCVAHSLDDERIAFDLRREHGIALPVIPMYDFDNDAIRDTYARTKLVIGMRGHAGMIPFGCGTPIISLISHPKMAYFLADIDRPEWGISVHDRHLGARLAERAAGLLDDHAATVADVHGLQQELWKVTEANAADLRVIQGGVTV